MRKVDPEKAREIMIEAGLEPQTPYAKATTPWPCICMTCGNKSTPTYANVKAGRGCLYCGRAKISKARSVPSDEALAEMREAGFEPQGPYPGANEAWPSICGKCGNLVRTSLSSIRAGGGCKRCNSGKHLRVPDEQAVREMRDAGLEPLIPYPGANESWPCRCMVCGGNVTPSLTRVREGHGCWDCNVKGRPQIPEAQAVAEMRSAGYIPLEPYPGTVLDRWLCECEACGYIATPRLAVARHGSRCRACNPAGKPRIPDEQADAEMRAAGLEPLEPYTSSMTPWQCKCTTCQEVTYPTLANIRRGHGGCRACGHAKRARTQMLAPGLTVAMMRAAGVDPLVPYPGMNQPWRSVCLTCHAEVTPALGNVQSGQGACDPCSRKRQSERQTLASGEAWQSMLDAGLQPLEPYPGNVHLRWRSQCTRCQTIVAPRLNDIRSGGGGCRTCSPSGLDYAAPAIVYVITHAGHDAHKVGVGGYTSLRCDRLSTHQKLGWQTFKILRCATGRDAYVIEQAVLRYIRNDLGFPPYLSTQQMPQGGWTETIGADAISLPQLWSIVQREAASGLESRLSLDLEPTSETPAGDAVESIEQHLFE